MTNTAAKPAFVINALGSDLIRAGHDLEKMAVGVVEIQAPATVVLIGFASALFAGIGPVLHAALANARESPVEFILADEKRVVLHRNRALAFVEVERHAVVELNDQHGPELDGIRKRQDVHQESCRLSLVAAPDNRVV